MDPSRRGNRARPVSTASERVDTQSIPSSLGPVMDRAESTFFWDPGIEIFSDHFNFVWILYKITSKRKNNFYDEISVL